MSFDIKRKTIEWSEVYPSNGPVPGVYADFDCPVPSSLSPRGREVMLVDIQLRGHRAARTPKL